MSKRGPIKLPLHQDPDAPVFIFDAEENAVAEALRENYDVGITNAAFIVEACNAYEALRTALEEKTRRVEVLEGALKRAAAPLDCGCVPCVGLCRNEEALEIHLDALRDLATAALTPEPSHVSKKAECSEENHNPMTHWPVGCAVPPLEGDGT